MFLLIGVCGLSEGLSMESVLTFAEYIDLLHGFAGIVVGGFFVWTFIRY